MPSAPYVTPPLTEHLYRKADVLRLPLGGTFELLPLCNMACKMCYVRLTKEQMQEAGTMRSADEWLDMARQCCNAGMLYLLITGGEPFLYPELEYLYTQLRKMGLVISINTNATCINEQTVSWLRRDPPQRLNITLYGASDATYARLCGNPHGFTQADQAITMLREAGIPVKLNCSVTPENRDDLEQMIQYAEARELILQATTYMFPPLRRDASQVGHNDRFSAQEAAELRAWIEHRQRGADQFREHCKAWRAGEYMRAEDDCGPLPPIGDGLNCRAGRSSFWITWDGRMLPCGMLTEPVTYPFTSGFDSAWKALTQVSDQLRLPAKCSACGMKQQCHACAAMCLTETGRFDGVPEYYCELTHAYGPACEQLLEP